ncbi:MAG TPA: DUF2911 domain-containing protein [Saprospiraceae bacterium]|nr:DUF2911 domain-containing protein [Saprospiraceae bacterium]
MSKTLKIVLIVLGGIVGLGLLGYFVGLPYMMEQTKKASPEQTIAYNQLGLDLEVFYCRPSKKGRDVFAEEGLVPYGEVWRTGANEATTFETATNLNIQGEILPAGKYTLWTIPGENSWEIIFNEKMYDWGVGWGAKAAVEREHDALVVTAPAETTGQAVEMFTIEFQEMEELYLALKWDDTRVKIPISGE